MSLFWRSALLVLIAAAAAGVAWAVRYREPVGPPVIACPENVDLGPQSFGAIVVGRFRVENRGSSPLVLGQFSTSCSCAGVEIEEGGTTKRVEDVHIPPGGSTELLVRIAIGARPGTSQVVHVSFRTNDSDRPGITIPLFTPRVIGGLYAEPESVVFGDVPVGLPASRTIRLYATEEAGRSVREVRSRHPDLFATRFIPPNGTEPAHETAGRYLGTVEVVARTDRPVPLEGEIQVVIDEQAQAPEKISVVGAVVPAIVSRPAILLLPRHANGKPLWSGQIALTGRDGAEISLAVESVPDGLTATVRADPANPGQWLLDVTARPAGLARREVAVRLRADLKPGGTVSVSVPVVLSPGDP